MFFEGDTSECYGKYCRNVLLDFNVRGLAGIDTETYKSRRHTVEAIKVQENRLPEIIEFIGGEEVGRTNVMGHRYVKVKISDRTLRIPLCGMVCLEEDGKVFGMSTQAFRKIYRRLV